MGFSNKSLPFLDSQLSSYYKRYLEERSESLAFQVLVSPTQYSENTIDFDPTKMIFRTRKLKDLVGLALIHWYLPDEVRFLVHLLLEEITWPSDTPYDVQKILLTSKEYSLAWLINQEWWNENDFFGNILDKSFARRFIHLLSFRRIPRRKVKKYTGYCRGYRDSTRRGPRPLPPDLLWTREDEESRRVRQCQRTQNLILEMNKIEEFLAS